VNQGGAEERLIESLRDLIRIPSINPPDPAGPELAAAHYLRDALADVGVPAQVHEPVPGRGSVTARLHGDGTGGEPLLLLSHLDVVPAPTHRWTHDPFGAEVADGYIYGRGAVDMKHLVAMELEVMLRLAEEARAAGRDPASDPIPGLRRAAAAINEAGGVSAWLGDRRLYPIQVAEKGYAVYRITIHGTAGHGSMPRPDNAAILAADAITRLGAPGPFRLTPTMATFFDEAAAAVDPIIARILRSLKSPAGVAEAGATAASTANLCSPVYARVANALVRDTISPNIVHAGVKYNVIPGVAVVEVDCRTLPGTSEEAMEAIVRERLGPDLVAVSTIELIVAADPVVASTEGGLYPILAQAIRDHDPDGMPVPIMAPFATDAKHLVSLGVPSYGFSPLRQERDETFIDRYHSVDERVSLAGLQWGLPVLYDAVRRFCG